jgi:hypothetical protein
MILLVASPDRYDYLHQLILNPDNTCEFADGGGQCINGIWNGNWILIDNVLKLSYNEFNNYDDIQPIDPPIEIEIEVEIINEHTKFFDGYCLKISEETWKLSKSPCPSFVNQKNNLYNFVEDINEDNTPLIFYKNVNHYVYNEATECILLRFANESKWRVESIDDNEPLVRSIELGLENAKVKIQNAKQQVQKFIDNNKDHLQFLAAIDNNYKFTDTIAEKQAYEYKEKAENSEVNEFFKNLCTIKLSKFDKAYEIFKIQNIQFDLF